jgi:hypothetical protein
MSVVLRADDTVLFAALLEIFGNMLVLIIVSITSWKALVTAQADDDVQSPALTEERAEWGFEEILATRERGRGNQVLVKWARFETPTWELQELSRTEALHAYEAEHGNIAL